MTLKNILAISMNKYFAMTIVAVVAIIGVTIVVCMLINRKGKEKKERRKFWGKLAKDIGETVVKLNNSEKNHNRSSYSKNQSWIIEILERIERILKYIFKGSK